MYLTNKNEFLPYRYYTALYFFSSSLLVSNFESLRLCIALISALTKQKGN